MSGNNPAKQKQRTLARTTRWSRAVPTTVVSLLLALCLLFLGLPVASLFLRSGSSLSLHTISDPIVLDALRLSLSTAAATTLIVVLAGTPVSYINARYRYPGKELIDSLIDLPVVMPPAVAGIALLMAFGRMGVLGRHTSALGLEVAFTTLAVVIAQIFVAAPFFLRQARSSFQEVDANLEAAARTLGSTPTHAFLHVTMPLATQGLISGAIMTFSRALGEFGATIMFAGNFQGRTQTMPLAIYTAMQSDINVSLCISLLLVIISFVVIFLVKSLARRNAHAAG
ncbi:MAG: Molybdate/tungstate transport system permease protein WtpB [Methanosaeta sp. PtaB.Bin039]|nr:MAG: Molybdate/tungstate transport system permease protein WtpB [Methanosaeta sp. PtaB.Bin039]HOT06182.1 ABC transporter permease [Methanotrichaceae archaeon]HQF15509.1 ABC transporter permease [Methanotrichaceae archaeon]HQI90244.1 ABC transporter permease [Methanotrichaceae archaeon]HQJ27787.1 ABC transporter permease [Methanotrichaceae archaeon]